MDFTAALTAFHGALISADNVHSFTTINCKGGNEEKVRYIISSIKRFLEAEKYINVNGLIEDKEPNTRKFFMYLVLNGDLPVLQDLHTLSVLESVIWSLPTLAKYLMCEMIWQLHMERFLYELIPSCWPGLGIQVAEAFLENFKYFNPIECLHKLQKLCAACYTLICRFTSFRIQDENLLKKIFEILLKYLKYYTNPPNENKLDVLSTDDLYKYKADRFKSILYLVLECCDLFTQRLNFRNDHPLYKLTYMYDNIIPPTSNVCDCSNKAILVCLKNCNVFLLDIFQTIVMDISVDLFCAWSEYEENGKTLQQSIGELCHRAHVKLLNISSMSEHPVLAMLQVMARKPTNINDLINALDTAAILEKINSKDKDSHLWIHALINKENLYQFNELLVIVDANLDIFNDKEYLVLYNKIKRIKCDDSVRNNLLIGLRIKLFHKCNINDKHIILKDHFRNKLFFDTVMPNGPNFTSMLITTFNKFITQVNVDMTDILTAFYQKPGIVYAKIFWIAAQNPQLTKPMLKVMFSLKDFHDHYYINLTEPCGIKIMQFILKRPLTPKETNNVIKFCCELKNNNLVSSSQLLLLVIMPGIHEALIQKRIKTAHIHLKLLIAAFRKEELSSYKAPLVVNLAQTLMVVRRAEAGLKDFIPAALETVETILKFLKTIISTYKDQLTAQESNWIRHKLLSLHLSPLNFYHFKPFWNNSHTILFESVTDQIVRRDTSLDALASKLRQILSWAVLGEWCEIWDSFVAQSIKRIDVLRVFDTSMHSIIDVINRNRNPNTLAALFYCYRNYIHIIRYKYFEEPLQDTTVKSCISLLANNLKKTKTEDFNQIETIVLPIFSYLAEKKVDFGANVVEYFVDNPFLAVVNKFLRTEL